MIDNAVQPAIDLSLEAAIDPKGSRYKVMLNHLQGNILKPHGRDHVQLLLIRFTAGPAEVKGWLRSFAANWLTSTAEQLLEVEAHRGKVPTGVFGSLFLTAAGYQALGLTREEILQGFGDQNQRAAFTAGMAAAQQMLSDPDPTSWDNLYYGQGPIHAMALLAAEVRQLVEWASARAERSLAGVGVVAGREVGAVLREQDRSIEPFGFADGLSQPLFFQDDLKKEAEKRGGIDVWNPLAPLGLVLIADPFTQEPDSFGSFLVFRKLEQNVKRFKERLQEVARKYTGGDEELAGAFLVGRFKNGTPVIAYRQSTSGPGCDFNNFQYFRRDPTGSRCPFHTHIGKTNPRGRSIGMTSHDALEERTHRIVRRGVPYDDREVRDGDAEEGVGLLFLCFQANITNQFAFIQETWTNAQGFPRPDSGIDPLVGRAIPGQTPDQHWPTAWDGEAAPQRNEDFGQLVTLKGGEFFFAPSIPFLKGL